MGLLSFHFIYSVFIETRSTARINVRQQYNCPQPCKSEVSSLVVSKHQRLARTKWVYKSEPMNLFNIQILERHKAKDSEATGLELGPRICTF